MKSKRKKLKSSADINLIPFIDIMLVLLVVFMITTPMSDGNESVSVNLPKTSQKYSKNIYKKKDVIIVSISKDGLLYLNNKKSNVKKSEIESFATLFLTKNKSSVAFIKADMTTHYQMLIEVMDILKKSGYINVGLIIEKK